MYILRFINQNKNDNNNNYWKFATFHTFKFTHWWKSSQTLHNHEYQQYETCWMYEHALAILNSLYTYILATYTVKRSSQIDEWYIVQCTYNINANTSKKKKKMQLILHTMCICRKIHLSELLWYKNLISFCSIS